MALSNSPYIAFPGNAAEAFPYYAELFGGELMLMKYEDMPSMDGMPFTPPPGAVAHCVLTAPGLTLSGGDAMGEDMPGLESEVYSFLLTFDTVEEARAFIEKIVDGGGEILMPFEPAPWGDTYGQVKDRFGVKWDVNVEGAQG